MKSSLADQLREKRRSLKMTQQQLADLLGVTEEMVSEMETGVKALPTERLGDIRRFVLTGKVSSSRKLGG